MKAPLAATVPAKGDVGGWLQHSEYFESLKNMTVPQYNVQTQYLGGVKLLMSHVYEG